MGYINKEEQECECKSVWLERAPKCIVVLHISSHVVIVKAFDYVSTALDGLMLVAS